MAKIIVKVPSVSSGKGAGGMVDYVAKREGVDKSVNRSVSIKAPTQKQMDYINELVKICPDAKESFEYKDYIENPTRQNASAFISVVAEHNPQLFEDKETYLNYIATRPNVEKGPEHGLFGNEDNINLPEVKKGLSEHKAVVWLPIISLRREDASLLGYDNAESWRDLIRSKQMDMAKAFGIPDDKFKWYAAFHNEGHHPHIHMVVYAENSNRGHLSEKGIEQIKSMFANEIFKDEMYNLYDEKGRTRDRISDEAKEKLTEIADRISKKDYSDSEICPMLISLADKLKEVSGKKQYGYLPKSLKKDVDDIVKTMAKDKDISELYSQWCDIQQRIVGIYHSKEIEHPPLWENKEFRKIKNAVIDEAKKLGDDRFSVPRGPKETPKEPPKQEEDEAEPDIPDEALEQDDEPEQTQTPEPVHHAEGVAMSAMNLFCRLASIIENDADKKIDGHNKTIVDSKERKEEIKKKLSLGIKMG